MATATQISAHVSRETKERLERYAREHGVKKAHLIETALLHHMNALDEIPQDIVIPPLVVVSRRSGERIIERILDPGEPTDAMKALVDDQD